MQMKIEVAQLRLAREIDDAETALNEALLKQTALFAAMVSARSETGVSPFLGQDALMRLVKSQQSLLSSGGDLARVHSRLLKINEEVTGAGVDECPDDWRAPTGISEDRFAA